MIFDVENPMSTRIPNWVQLDCKINIQKNQLSFSTLHSETEILKNIIHTTSTNTKYRKVLCKSQTLKTTKPRWKELKKT